MSKSLHQVMCSDCDGEGTYAYVGGPGYFSSAFGNYLPTDELRQCETCSGDGWVWEEGEDDG